MDRGRIKADLRKIEEIKNLDLGPHRAVVFGGGLHAVGVNGLKEFKKRWGNLEDKKLAVFAVGASPATKGIVEEIARGNFTEDELGRLRLFYLRGGYDFRKLDFKNKILMQLLQWKLTLKKKKTADEIGMWNAYRHPKDFARREYIRELVDYVKGER